MEVGMGFPGQMGPSSFLDAVRAKGLASEFAAVAADDRAFRIRAKRNRLMAEWVADLTDESDSSWFRLLLDIDFARQEGPEADRFLLLKIRNDLMGFGVFLSEAALAQSFAGFRETARRCVDGEDSARR